MRDFVFKAVRLCYNLSLIGLLMMAVAAVLGFVHPFLDSFNHLQALIFLNSLVNLLLTPIFLRTSRWRGALVVVAATAFVASSAIVIPEAVGRLKPMPAKPVDGRPVYTLMTHNVFRLNEDSERLLENIRKVDPDILTLQEYYPPDRRELDEALRAIYPYFVICVGEKRENIAMYSRLEFKGERAGACDADSGELRISRIIGRFTGADGNPFSVVTTHLDWPAQLSQLRRGINTRDGFDRMFARQRGQFAQLTEALGAVDGPMVLTADFNSTSWSYTLRQFELSAGLERQDRLMLSYPTLWWILDDWRPTLPFLPLDHVMTRDGVVTHSVEFADPGGSDHLPLVVKFSVEGRGLRMAAAD